MLSTTCGACRKPRGLHEMHGWSGSVPLCSAACVEKHTPIPEDPKRLRARALDALSAARRASDQVNVRVQLHDDRQQAANAILGLTKSGRAERAALLAEAAEHMSKLDDLEYDFEQNLTVLACALMGLREASPELAASAVTVAREHPGNSRTLSLEPATQQLADRIEGKSAPLVREVTAREHLRVERHLDALVGFKMVRLQQTRSSLWLIEGSAPWQRIEHAELVDSTLHIAVAGEDAKVEINAPKVAASSVWGWLAAERADLQPSERTMTALEAVQPPGCLLLAIVVGGAVLGGGAHLVGLPEIVTQVIAGLSGLLSVLAVGWGVRELMFRRPVPQLGVQAAPLARARSLPSRG